MKRRISPNSAENRFRKEKRGCYLPDSNVGPAVGGLLRRRHGAKPGGLETTTTKKNKDIELVFAGFKSVTLQL